MKQQEISDRYGQHSGADFECFSVWCQVQGTDSAHRTFRDHLQNEDPDLDVGNPQSLGVFETGFG